MWSWNATTLYKNITCHYTITSYRQHCCSYVAVVMTTASYTYVAIWLHVSHCMELLQLLPYGVQRSAAIYSCHGDGKLHSYTLLMLQLSGMIQCLMDHRYFLMMMLADDSVLWYVPLVPVNTDHQILRHCSRLQSHIC